MKSRYELAFTGLAFASAALVAGPANAALPPWSQRVAELHAVLDAGALALAGSGEIIVSVTFENPDYLIRTEHCTVRAILTSAKGAVDGDAVPGARAFAAKAESPVCE